ncbi:hypothetical protein L1887_35331 [Cichorium endivia]|nr:hypothetical protein L1887_35331 [Cichorium endivia]
MQPSNLPTDNQFASGISFKSNTELMDLGSPVNRLLHILQPPHLATDSFKEIHRLPLFLLYRLRFMHLQNLLYIRRLLISVCLLEVSTSMEVSPTTDGSSDDLVPSTSPKQQPAQRSNPVLDSRIKSFEGENQ